MAADWVSELPNNIAMVVTPNIHMWNTFESKIPEWVSNHQHNRITTLTNADVIRRYFEFEQDTSHIMLVYDEVFSCNPSDVIIIDNGVYVGTPQEPIDKIRLYDPSYNSLAARLIRAANFRFDHYVNYDIVSNTSAMLRNSKDRAKIEICGKIFTDDDVDWVIEMDEDERRLFGENP